MVMLLLEGISMAIVLAILGLILATHNWGVFDSAQLKLSSFTFNLELGSFQNGETLNAPLGQSLGTIRGTDYVYTNGQKTVGPDGQYLISATSNNNIGNTNPDWTGGINNSFNYKSFSLSFLIDIRHGGSVFSNDLAYGLADGIYPLTAYTNDLGKPVRNPLNQGGGMIRPGVYANGQPNTTRVTAFNYGDFGDGAGLLPLKAFVYDASFVKLREAINRICIAIKMQ